MIALRITLQTLRLLAAQPLAWLGCAALLAVWPLISLAAPIGINTDFHDGSGLIQDVAFMAAVLGGMTATGALQRLSGLIAHASAGPGLGTDMLALGSIMILSALIATSSAILMGEVHPDLFAGSAGSRLALGFTAIAALGCVLLRLHLPAGSGQWLLGAAVLLAPLVFPHPLPTHSLAALAAALLSAAWLLDHPPGRAA